MGQIIRPAGLSLVLVLLLASAAAADQRRTRESTGARTAAPSQANTVSPPSNEQAPTAAEKEEAEDEVNNEFLGIEFGLGFGLTQDLSKGDRIDEAEVINGIVRVKKTSNARPRVLLETHYFFTLDSEEQAVEFRGRTINVNAADVGIGPFVAIQGSDDQVLEAIAFGAMVGFKRSENTSLNLGIGLALDTDGKTLADGIEANKPLPTGETAIRYLESGRWGLLVLASFSF